MKKVTTASAAETQEFAKEFAKEILKKNPGKTATVLALQGDLGAGKTTFLQGFAKGLGIDEVVNSPTFVVMKKFQIDKSKFSYFYHFDCYRLTGAEEVLHLGFKEIISDPKNIVAIEWSERILPLLPKNSISIHFIHEAGDNRTLKVEDGEL